MENFYFALWDKLCEKRTKKGAISVLKPLKHLRF